ncbi:single-stranded DNA-binding protein [Desulfospira joergensenii]|uniref:single-stranded DNA-binding protein n=1 Tax=Desulfospira joergensenii TaxID=53329 RepID=UPI0003B495ED|nr:single-stranded DNA-binding protein [Desulfospira joergensenii]
MGNLNRVMLIGRLGRDPEIRYTQQGGAVVNSALATSDFWNDKNTGERRERTEWHRIVLFGKQAETFEKYMSKGSQVYVEGRLQTSSYEKEGQTHYSTDIIVSNFQFLDSKTDSQAGAQGGYSGGGQQGGGYPQKGGGGYSQQGGSAPNSNNFQGQTSPGMTGGGQAPIPDDDIPF